MADTGWAGRWEPNVVGEGTLNELRDRVGEPIFRLDKAGNPQGRPIPWVTVHLYTGEVIYPGGRA